MNIKEQILLHTIISVFIDRHYDDMLDYGLMDDILVNEYKAGIVKMDSMCAERLVNTARWLDTVLSQMVICAKDNLAVGRNYPIYSNFLRCVEDNTRKISLE